MRLAFTASELRLGHNLDVEFRAMLKEFDGDAELALKAAARRIKLKGKVSFGVYRVALVTDTLVFKVQFQTRSTRLTKEFEFINKMKSNPDLSRFFPLTQLISPILMIQERVHHVGSRRMDAKFGQNVEELGERLGIDDVHIDNYGWSGPKNREWPVFIDVDFRVSPKTAKSRVRSWMSVAA